MNQTKEIVNKLIIEAKDLNRAYTARLKSLQSLQSHRQNSTFPKSYNSIHIPNIQYDKDTSINTINNINTLKQESINKCKEEILSIEMTFYNERMQECKNALDKFINRDNIIRYINTSYPSISQQLTTVNEICQQFYVQWAFYLDIMRMKSNTEDNNRNNNVRSDVMDITQTQDVSTLTDMVNKLTTQVQTLLNNNNNSNNNNNNNQHHHHHHHNNNNNNSHHNNNTMSNRGRPHQAPRGRGRAGSRGEQRGRSRSIESTRHTTRSHSSHSTHRQSRQHRNVEHGGRARGRSNQGRHRNHNYHRQQTPTRAYRHQSPTSNHSRQQTPTRSHTRQQRTQRSVSASRR